MEIRRILSWLLGKFLVIYRRVYMLPRIVKVFVLDDLVRSVGRMHYGGKTYTNSLRKLYTSSIYHFIAIPKPC